MSATQHESHDSNKALTGFWIYLMTDSIMFASLFAVFAVLRHNTFGGESTKELLSPSYALVETLVLLTSSFACGLMLIAAKRNAVLKTQLWLYITFLLGAIFLTLELVEFRQLIAEGNSWRTSAFLSSFFTLVGTHGVHITIGLIWAITMSFRINKRGINEKLQKQLQLFSMYWHFLDIIWICIFTVVYLRGVM